MSIETPTSPTKPMSLFRQIEEISLGSAANSFSELLCEHAARDPRICYVGVDTMDAEFQRRFPERAFDVGIAEQNELGIATGLARMGLIPVVQAWSPFTPLRNFEQLRTYFCRHNSNGKLITTTLGLTNCSHGTTHHDLETIALYRVVPNLTVIAAMDDAQFRLAFPVAMAHVGPIALMGPPEIYAPGHEGLEPLDIPPHGEFRIGQAEWLRRGRDAVIISVGAALRYSWQAAKALGEEGIDVSVINMTSLKPLDAAAVLEAARTHRAVLTVEEQSIIGGLGSACAEVIAENGIAVPFRRLGIPDQFCENLGDWTYTREQIGLTRVNVAEAVRALLKNGGAAK
jgi:transketolase